MENVKFFLRIWFRGALFLGVLFGIYLINTTFPQFISYLMIAGIGITAPATIGLLLSLIFFGDIDD